MAQPEDEQYIILKLSDAKLIEQFFAQEVIPRDYGYVENNRILPKLMELQSILERFKKETGANMQSIARGLKHTPICAACAHESMEHTCQSIWSQKAGRRLQRLIDRAHGIIRQPDNKEEEKG